MGCGREAGRPTCYQNLSFSSSWISGFQITFVVPVAGKTSPALADHRLSTQPDWRTPKAFASRHNADAHLKRQVMGREVVVAITKGKLDFGPWEQIFYGEFDGKRRKRVLVKIIGD
jgi:hypothetical protein